MSAGRHAPDALSLDEAAALELLRVAIERSLRVARDLPTSFDSHTRALVVMKLQESQFWASELLRGRD